MVAHKFIRLEVDRVDEEDSWYVFSILFPRKRMPAMSLKVRPSRKMKRHLNFRAKQVLDEKLIPILTMVFAPEHVYH